jgi:iron complex transport system ATP-binding protein
MHFDFKNVSARRGCNLALDNVSFTIQPGEHTVILGPNGAGKSTLLKLLYRELYPNLGDDSHLKLFGQSRWNVWELRDRMGLVSLDQQRRYNVDILGMDVVLSGFFSTIGNVREDELTVGDRETAEATINRLKIGNLMERPFARMSTGERRRCLLARALVNDPEVLVLDEPTAGLDVPSMFRYFDLVADLIDKQKTIVLVTHHVHEIPPEIENVILLKQGRILASGAKRDVLTEEMLSKLFDVELCLAIQNQHYSISPKG